MVLAPHAIAGAAVALAFKKHPILGLFAAFMSHFVLDAVPHWHYRVDSIEKDASVRFGQRLNIGKQNLSDLGRIAVDFCIGLVLMWLIAEWAFPHYLLLMTAGALAGALPDALQIVYYFFPNSPFKFLQQFHLAVHAKKRLDDRHVFGIACQLVFSVAIILILAYA